MCEMQAKAELCFKWKEILLGPGKNKGFHTLLPSTVDRKPWNSSQSQSFPSHVWIQTIVSHCKRLRSQGYVSIWFHLLTKVLAQFKTAITDMLKFHWTSSIKKYPEDTVWWALCMQISDDKSATYFGSLCPLKDLGSYKRQCRMPSFRALLLPYHLHETVFVPWFWVVTVSLKHTILQTKLRIFPRTCCFTNIYSKIHLLFCYSVSLMSYQSQEEHAENLISLMWNHHDQNRSPPQNHLLLYLQTEHFKKHKPQHPLPPQTQPCLTCRFIYPNQSGWF